MNYDFEFVLAFVNLIDKYKKPNKDEMDKRFYASARHTMQEDPLNYNDSIAEYFGARPSYLRHPKLAWRFAPL